MGLWIFVYYCVIERLLTVDHINKTDDLWCDRTSLVKLKRLSSLKWYIKQSDLHISCKIDC